MRSNSLTLHLISFWIEIMERNVALHFIPFLIIEKMTKTAGFQAAKKICFHAKNKHIRKNKQSIMLRNQFVIPFQNSQVEFFVISFTKRGGKLYPPIWIWIDRWAGNWSIHIWAQKTPTGFPPLTHSRIEMHFLCFIDWVGCN